MWCEIDPRTNIYFSEGLYNKGIDMSFETFFEIENYNPDKIIRYGDSHTIQFCGKPFVGDKNNRLFFKGETGYFYYWKSEPKAFSLYHSVEDALDYVNAKQSRYCLNFSSKNECNYPKRAYKKILFPPVLGYLQYIEYNGEWKISISCKADNLKISDNGYMHMLVELRTTSEGESKHSIAQKPNQKVVIDFPSGSYDYRSFERVIEIPKDVGSISFLIEGEHYSGEVYFEKPTCISMQGYNILPDFAMSVTNETDFDWIGQNLSKKEWPCFRISLNGKIFFEGELFERCHRYSENEIKIPNGLIKDGINELQITNVTSYPNPAPYLLKQMGIISETMNGIEIVALPKYVAVGKTFGVLVETKQDCVIKIETNREILVPAKNKYNLTKGLNVIEFKANLPALNEKIILITEEIEVAGEIKRILKKPDDGILVGSGDLIYVLQDENAYANYLKWYLSNGVGNLLTVRPTYRWSGSRTVDDKANRLLVDVLTQYGVKYVHMVDGRELSGIDANPSLKDLKGKNFLGRQTHEQDGVLLYWGNCNRNFYREQICDLIHLANQRKPENTNWVESVARYDYPDKVVIGRDLSVDNDMKALSDNVVRLMRKLRCSAIRHTGPSTAFKYFYQAGYDFLGAELMYGPTDIVLSALRGAAQCYKKTSFGGHFAVQWSTTPHDAEDRYRRFALSLYVSYIQGVTEFNVEEGLWHLEEFYSSFSRFDTACIRHLQEHQKFYDYICSHSRTGRYYTPFAVLTGRYDGWRSFGTGVWGQTGKDNTDAENSFNLLNLFYPLENANSVIYRHPCPKSEPIGLFSGNPRGNVDIIPIESDEKDLFKYKVICFMGYNKAEKEDFDKLLSFVENGGTLIMGWPHLSETTNRDDLVNYNHQYISHPILNSFSKTNGFCQDFIGGQPVSIAMGAFDKCDIIKVTDGGNPLVLLRKVGSGRILFVNAKQYPGNLSVKSVYEELILSVTDEINSSENVFVKCGTDVLHAVYIQGDDSAHVYLLAVDWYNDIAKPRSVFYRAYNFEYKIDVKFGSLIKIVTKEGVSVWCEEQEFEIIEVSTNAIKVQGEGKGHLKVAKDGVVTEYELDFTKCQELIVGIFN